MMEFEPGRLIVGWLMWVVCLYGLSAETQHDSETADKIEIVDPSAIISSGCEIDYPPFCYADSQGRAIGFSVELMRAALHTMGRDAEFRTGLWSEVRGWLERGEIDALPLVGRTPEREALFDFTFAYMTLHGAIVVRKGTTGIRHLGDLRGRSVAVMRGDNVEEYLRRAERGLEIHCTPTFQEALTQLSRGLHDAVVIQRLVALRLIQEHQLDNLEVLGRPIEGFSQDFCFAVKEEDRETLALLNEGLALVMADGTYRRLHSKWFAFMELPSDRPIVVGGDHDYPPFEFLDEHARPTGFVVDVTRAIAREMNMNIQIRLGPWSAIVDGLERGEVDAIQGMFYSGARDRTLDFTQPYLVSHYVSLVRRGDTPPEQVEELRNRKLAIQDGDVIEEFIETHQLGGETLRLETQEGVLRAVMEGRSDCALVPRISTLFLMEKLGLDQLELGRNRLFEGHLAFAVSQGEHALLAQFSEGLKILESRGEYQRIQDRWLRVYQKETMSFLSIMRYSAWVFIPLILALVTVLLWTRSLRQQVYRKTKELERSLERFRSVFECANAGKSITDLSGEVHANQAFADFLGYEVDELEGKRWQEITPAEDVPATEALIAPLLAGERDAARFEKRYLRKDGGVAWADVSVAIHRDEHHVPIHFITTVVDISQRKLAEKALQRSESFQRAMIACSPLALYTIDMAGHVTTWNASAERIFGWTQEEALGKSLPIVPDDRQKEFQDLRDLVGQGGGFSGRELIRVRKDGTLIPISLSVAPVRDDAGEVVAIMGAAEDISQRKQAEDELRESERRYRLLADNTLDVIWTMSMDLRFTYVNPAIRTLTGFSPKEWIGSRLRDHCDEAAFSYMQALIEREIRKGVESKGAIFEVEMLNRHQQPVPVEIHGTILFDSSGTPTQIQGVTRNIEERKQAQRALEHRDQLLREMGSLAKVGGWEFDAHTGKGTWTEETARIHEVDPTLETDMSRGISFYQGEHREKIEYAIQNAVERGCPYDLELELITAKGSRKWVRTIGRPGFDGGRVVQIRGSFQDITERKLAEMRIEHLNLVLRAIREVNQLIVRERDPAQLIRQGCDLLVSNRGYPSAMIVRVDEEDRLIDWAMAGMAGTSGELHAMLEMGQLPGCCTGARQEPGFILVEDRSKFCRPCPIGSACEQKQSLCSTLIHEGRLFGYLTAAAEDNLVLDKEEQCLFTEMAGDFAFALAAIHSEELRKQGAKAYQESESRFRLFAETAPVGIVISDRSEQTLYVSPKFTELFGYTEQDMPSISQWWALAYPDETLRRQVQQEWQCAMDQARHQQIEPKPLEFPVSCKDGSVRQIEFRAAVTKDWHVIVFSDVSERKKSQQEQEQLQAQLLQAQKMESVGRLAGGVAHDYNNMLSVILGFTELAMDKTNPGEPLYQDLREILTATRRSADITRQLLAFARRQTIRPQILDLNQTVGSSLRMLRRLIGENIELSWHPTPSLWEVKVDPAQIDQILANLLVNARDAIADVGQITIETHKATFDDAYCAEHIGFVPGDFSMLAVSDTGVGMDRETLSHAFEPFFTTKALHEGTGLGLATVYGIVKQNQGFINVYSEPGAGTTFRVYFPRCQGTHDRPRGASASEIPLGQGETVLIVEDEISILRLTRRVLDELGYQVLAAQRPQQAIELARNHSGPIQLLLTDVVMPGMNGRELAEQLTAVHKNMKVLFMSGYTANVIAHQGVLDEGVNFMQKPFSNQELATHVRRALGKS